MPICSNLAKSCLLSFVCILTACGGGSGGDASGASSTSSTGSSSSTTGSSTTSSSSTTGSSSGDDNDSSSSTTGSSTSGSSTSSSSGSAAIPLPGRILATDYVAAFDTTPENSGDCGDGPVDKQISTDTEGGECTVGWTRQGEWLAYEVSSTDTQKMDIVFRVATNQASRGLKIQVNDKTVGRISVSGSAYDEWQNVALKAVEVPAGENTIKVEWMTGSVNVNFIDFSAHQAYGQTTSLWGADGSDHDPSGFLSDWSYAGYHWGEEHPPVKAPTINVVTDHGATPNDDVDDSEALIAALAAAAEGDVVYIPAGRFILSQVLSVPNGVVLQGAGSELTTLDIPTNLETVSGIDPSFTGGFIEMKGSSNDGSKLSDITVAAARGDTQITVESATGVSVGDWIQIQQEDVGGNLLLEAMYEGYTAGLDDYSNLVNDAEMEFFSRVTQINGRLLTLERPLPISVKPEYNAELHTATVAYGEVGVEGITLAFPQTDYPGHFNEAGYNGIDMRAQHSWVRDVVVKNIDYGINLRGSHFVSILDFTVVNENDRSGHHGISVGSSTDCLIRGFDIQAELVHDLTVEWYAYGNVFTQGRGTDITLDHHRAAAYANLFTDMDLGQATRAWKTGGRSDRGYKTAAYSTFWNITAEKAIEWPADDFGPRMVFMGLTMDGSHSSVLDWLVEDISADDIYPPNLWLSQREKRLGRQ